MRRPPIDKPSGGSAGKGGSTRGEDNLAGLGSASKGVGPTGVAIPDKCEFMQQERLDDQAAASRWFTCSSWLTVVVWFANCSRDIALGLIGGIQQLDGVLDVLEVIHVARCGQESRLHLRMQRGGLEQHVRPNLVIELGGTLGGHVPFEALEAINELGKALAPDLLKGRLA